MAIDFEKNASNKSLSIVTVIGLLIFLPLLLYGSYQTAVLISRASGKPAKIIVDASRKLEPIRTSFYHAFSQGGEEPTDMLKPITDELKELKPEIIRIDHIFDYFNVVTKNGNDLSFDFSRLDQSVNTILSLNAIPLFSLSYMPPTIGKDGSLINPPNNWDDWAQLVQKTIEHYSGKDQKNITGVYYEVWNEPDLDQFGKWSYGNSDKNYMTLYEYASKGAKQAQNVNSFFIGGPATTGLYKNWITALVELGNRGARIDFLSWHTYLDDPSRYMLDQQNLVNWLMPYPQYVLLPKLITEYGFTGSKDMRYGTNFASAFTVASIRQMLTGGPTYAFAFQPKDGPGQEKGDGWGFLTHETNGKQKKPRFYVFPFVDQMQGTRLQMIGEGSWVTGFASINDDSIKVLLVNYDRYGSHIETVPVTISNIKPGNYSYHEQVLKDRDTTSNETVESTTITKQIYLPAQSIAIITLTPK
jgi:hypothetical protein